MRLVFAYSSRPWTQGALTAVQIGAAVAIGAHPSAGNLWGSLVRQVPEWFLIVGVPWIGHALLYWSATLAFHYVDTKNRPSFIARYRIQSGPKKRPPIRRVLRNLLVNQLLLTPIMLLGMWALLRLRGWAPSPELPSLLTVLGELAGLGLVSVIWFYGSHRFLHRPWWMKNVHQVHHEYRTTSAMASEYAHWFEFVAANFGTLACGVVLIAPSLATIYLYSLVAVSTILVHHSGYALPWASWSVHHDWHHFRYKECFGTLGYLDRLLGTDQEFRTLRDGDTR
jgi:sterol desaturase/sphingolipid hydroxylase (fatty acid hydroxylase superfamily)